MGVTLTGVDSNVTIEPDSPAAANSAASPKAVDNLCHCADRLIGTHPKSTIDADASATAQLTVAAPSLRPRHRMEVPIERGTEHDVAEDLIRWTATACGRPASLRCWGGGG